MSYDLGDYVDVQTRIKLFYERYPDGSLQFEFKGQMPGNPDFIWGVATAYRTPDDPRPSTGTASEQAQGKTAYTRGSELMNLETSALGRAISSFGIGIGKSMASKQEVEMAKARQIEPMQVEEPYDPWASDRLGTMSDAINAMGATIECACGVPMVHKTGNRKSDGKPYSGFFCANNNDACKPVWDK
jgi:hypothetical protein